MQDADQGNWTETELSAHHNNGAKMRLQVWKGTHIEEKFVGRAHLRVSAQGQGSDLERQPLRRRKAG
jgi:hypothetical protein